MATASISDRIDQQLEALEAWMPGLVERLRMQRAAHGDPAPWSADDLQAEEQQIEAWLAAPDGSTIFSDPDLLNALGDLQARMAPTGCQTLEELTLERIHDLADDLHYFWALAAAARFAQQHGIPCLQAPPFRAPRGLFVYGIGSGRQLSRVLARAQADVVLIFESDLQRLLAALAETDLASQLAPYAMPGRGLFLVTSPEPDRAFEEATILLSQTNLFILDALLICDCDPRTESQQLRERFSPERHMMMLSYLGFFVDELHMLMNATTTFRHLGAYVLAPGMVEPHDHHAVIAVSGPSLRQHLPLLAAERERYTLFSGWSTLGTLLNAGIVPDFHCPMERHVVHHALQDPDLTEALAGMALVGPSSLDPRQISYYAERYLLFRSASTPSAVYAEEASQVIDGEGPITVNMAALAAVLLGFRNLHFFGVDCGTTNLEDKRNPDALLHTPYEFPHQETGVGGAVVHTNAVMLDARRAIERLLAGWFTEGQPITGHNFSGGLSISGAPETPMGAFSSLLGEAAQRQSHLSLPLQLQARSGDWAERRWRLARLRDQCLANLNTLRTQVGSFTDPATLLVLTDFTDNFSKPLLEQIPLRLYCGTVFRTWFGLVMLHRRLVFASSEQEALFLQECQTILERVLDSLEALSFELFDYLEDLDSLTDFNFASKRP